MSEERAATIRQQMRGIRSELREDATALVENARLTFDWHHYVRQYPWACVGAAAFAGYFVVPRAAPKMAFDNHSMSELVRQVQSAVAPADPVKKTGFLMATVLPFLLKSAASSAMSFFQSGGFASNRARPQAAEQQLARPLRPR